MKNSASRKMATGGLALIALALAPALQAAESPATSAQRYGQYIFQSIGCQDQSTLMNSLAAKIRREGLINNIGLDDFVAAAKPSLTQWCEFQVSPNDKRRAQTLAYCQRTYGKQLETFLSKIYSAPTITSEMNFNVFNRFDRQIAPACRVTTAGRRTIKSGTITGDINVPITNADGKTHLVPQSKTTKVSVTPAPVPPSTLPKYDRPLHARIKDGAENLLGLSSEHKGFYSSRFRNKQCPAWRKYVDQIVDPNSALKQQANQCSRANQTALNVIGAIAPQGGYKMVGTGVNVETHLGNARTYGFSKTKKGQVICPHGDTDCLKANPKAVVLPSYCSGATFTALVGTLNTVSPEIFSLMTSKQLDNFQPGLDDDLGLYGLINNSRDGIRDAAKEMSKYGKSYSFGKIIDTASQRDPFQNMCAGDFFQMDRKHRNEISRGDYIKGFAANGGGHSGVFLGVEKNDAGHEMAYFWSSNGDTHGYGVTCEPVAHLSPKAVRLTSPKKLLHIPEYRGQANLRGGIMHPELAEDEPAFAPEAAPATHLSQAGRSAGQPI